MAITEEVVYEGGPHVGDLIINTAVGATIFWLAAVCPSLSAASVGSLSYY
ncbi:MAG: hypothetical protein HC926_01980 [Synechococcaceae cyanobacterium SM2_3_60]|nr:hypothetical protein [Synechococcaceae cyanobacterium SM2_3_60]